MQDGDNTGTNAIRAPEGEDQLTPILDVERLEDNFFRGIATPEGKGRSFGGQVIAQALSAATRTVQDGRANHSLHAYFMRPGDATEPVLYQIERDRDGGSFTTRRVVAVQHGRPILNMAASFHVEEPGLSHQDDLPDVPPPDGLENEQQLAQRFRDLIPEKKYEFMKRVRPIEVRPVQMRAPFGGDGPQDVQQMWIRSRSGMGASPELHRAGLAYASDLGLLGAALGRHGLSFATRDIMVASLDHALWMHGEFRMDEWLLYEMDSTWTGGARAFCRGRIWTSDGRLVANVAQEGLIREVTR